MNHKEILILSVGDKINVNSLPFEITIKEISELDNEHVIIKCDIGRNKKRIVDNFGFIKPTL
jgi:hypothetical protein